MKSLLHPLALALSSLPLPVAAAQHPVLLYDEEVTAVQDELLEGVPADFDQDGAWDIASIGTYTMLHWQVADDVWLDRIVGQGDDRVHPADLDGDGLLDLVGVQGMEVGWYRQVADRRFDPFLSLGSLLLPGSASTGLELSGVATADFDADGMTDIVCTARVPLGAQEPGVIVVLDPASSAPELVYPVGYAGGVDAVCTADLDSDGTAEVFLATANTLQALERQGAFWSVTHSFQVPLSVGTPLREVDVFDLDLDGQSDVCLAGAVSISALLSSQGYGPIPIVQSSGAAWNWSEFEVGVAEDGLPVVMTRSSANPSSAGAHRWDSSNSAFSSVATVSLSGSFNSKPFSAGWSPRGRMFSVGPELASLRLLVTCGADVCSFGGGFLSSFAVGWQHSAAVHNLPRVGAYGPFGGLVDVSGDGRLDLVTTSEVWGPGCGDFGSGGTSLHRRAGGAFDCWSSGAPGGFNQYCDFGCSLKPIVSDLLNDGQASGAVVYSSFDPYDSIWWRTPEVSTCGPGSSFALGSGAGAEFGVLGTSASSGWGTCQYPGVASGITVSLIDMGWDHDVDLMVDDELFVIEDGEALDPVVYSGSNAGPRWARDLDGDLRLDLVVLTSAGVEWWRNNGVSGFDGPQLLWAGVGDLEIMDWDQDGLVDLIAVIGSNLLLRSGVGGGGFDAPVDVPLTGQMVPMQASAPQVADLDRDGDLDLLVMDASGPRPRFVVFMNQAGPHDCDGSGVADHEEIAAGVHEDTDRNGQPDRCDIAAGRHDDQNQNGVPDACEYVGEPWWITSPVNGHRYASTPPLSSDQARTLARAWGGSLVTIRSAAEQAWLQERFGTPADPVWIGLSDRQDEGQFRWHSKEASAFTSWASGMGIPGNPDDVLLDPASGEWFEADAALTFVAIVEQGDCDGDGEVDALQIELDPTLDWDGNGLLDSCTGLSANYCDANVNMDGLVGRISVAGSPLIGLNSLELMASEVPTNQFGYFVFSRTQGYLNPFGGGQGALCIAAPIRRLSGPGQVLNTGTTGKTTLPVDLTSLPSGVVVLAGESLNFQFWHREYDTSGNPTSNTTDAIEVCFR